MIAPRPLTPVIETLRLTLCPLNEKDAAAIQRLFPRWEIVRFLSAQIPWPYPENGAATFLREVALPAMREGREWHWSIRLKTEPQELIGVISLMAKPDDNRGFWLDPAWQGQGLMAEASTAVTDFWFNTLGQAVLRVPKAVENRSSRRISERTGMRVVWEGERDYVCGRKPAELWEITAQEWRAYRAEAPASERGGARLGNRGGCFISVATANTIRPLKPHLPAPGEIRPNRTLR